jgi:alpha-mannosidase
LNKYLLFFLLIISSTAFKAQEIAGFDQKISGEDIVYFSPFRNFAKQALLTRCDGTSPIEFTAQKPNLQEGIAQFRFLIGFSSGTSAADRFFDVYLNDSLLFTFKTEKRWSERQNFQLASNYAPQGHYRFTMLEKDINKDLFGYFELELPFKKGQDTRFKIVGRAAQSRDWLMLFAYQDAFKTALSASNLILRAEQLRPLNFECVIPQGADSIQLSSPFFTYQRRLRPGYHALSIAAYPKTFTGKDSVLVELFSLGSKINSLQLPVDVLPIKDLSFHIIHHSHNDIGYSHLQTEVAKIQTENIRTALRWIAKGGVGAVQPIWHVESLWAVENFLAEASAEEQQQFVAAVKSSHLVLSANYANVLTGLMRPEEFRWLTAYAKQLEQQFDIKISNAMVTDIPGQAYAAFEAYTQQSLPFLSLGPNYVQNLPDHGDRVGGFINETGDQPFLWSPMSDSSKKLFVWTAGKGYSYFHNIAANQQQFEWEKRISQYTLELANYPYDIVQLRYTKNADNGPVDTTLCRFVYEWNQKYSTPQLVIANLDTLFTKFLAQNKSVLPVKTGEISPYWEDGAYSTAAEEIQMRRLVQKVIDLEAHYKTQNEFAAHEKAFAAIHRNLILFHEHTWGSWCSISAPDTYFSTEQWRIKKAFLDSAQAQYVRLENKLVLEQKRDSKVLSNIMYSWSGKQPGLHSLTYENQELLIQDSLGLGALIYSLGIAPQKNELVPLLKTEAKSQRQTFANAQLKAQLNIEIGDNPNELIFNYSIDKKAIREKEALHVYLPFALQNPTLSYGEATLLNYPGDQMPGSNKEFICVPEKFILEDARFKITIYTPDCNLIEIGQPINEQQQFGAKVWSRETQDFSKLYLYVFNNYWHTNYKADQGGHLEFSFRVKVEEKDL